MKQEWKPVALALLGSWPQQVAGWGNEALAAYLAEIEARGVTPDRALVAVRTWPAGSDFPPSAPNLAAAARTDPSTPTFDEAYALVYGRGGVLRARPRYTGLPLTDKDYLSASRARLSQMHPRVVEFVERYGLERLRMLEVDHPDFGDLKRKELRAAWEQIGEALEGRDVAALASGRRGELVSLDPLAALGTNPSTPQIEAGS